MPENITDKEMDLRDFIDVIIRRKKTIIAVFLAIVALAAGISFLMPKVYEVSMVMEPGALKFTAQGKDVFFDSAKSIEAKIMSEVFNPGIIRALNLMPDEANLKFKVLQPKYSDLVKVSLVLREDKVDVGLKILKQLFVEVSGSYKEILEYYQKLKEQEIAVISNDIEGKKNLIKLNAEKNKILEARENALLAEIKEVKDNSEKMLAQRKALLSSESQTDNVTSLLFLNVIQQNIGDYNRLSDQLTDLKVQRESISINSDNMAKDIDNLQIKIEEKKLKKANIRNINLTHEPEVSDKPVAPKKVQNMAIGIILGIFTGVFIAFFQDFWEASQKTR